MSLISNVDEQREFLNNNLERINTVVSAIVGKNVELKIQEKTSHRGETYFKLVDDRNFRDYCGIMARAWKTVIIDTFNMWWTEDGVTLPMHFSYEHIDGGSNGAEFCRLVVENNLIKIPLESKI